MQGMALLGCLCLPFLALLRWFHSRSRITVETLLKTELFLDSALQRWYAFLNVITIIVKLELSEYLYCFLVLLLELLLVEPVSQSASVHLAKKRKLHDSSQSADLLRKAILVIFANLLVFLIFNDLDNQRFHHFLLLLLELLVSCF